MKVAVIGTGYWGRKHVEEYQRLGAEVVAVDPDAGKRAEMAERFGVACLARYEDALADPDVSAVSVCTPHATHYWISREALLAGKHVLVEKPMASNVREADELMALAREKGLVLCVGHVFRFNNAIEACRKLVESRAFGKIYTIGLAWTNLEPVMPDRDIVFDLGDHPLDIILYLTGETPNAVFAHGDGFRQKNEEVAVINYHVGDVFVNVELSWVTPVKRRTLSIIGSEKSAIVDCLAQKVTLVDNRTREETTLDVEPNNTLQDELGHFLRSVETGLMSDKVSGKVGREIIRLLGFARHSILTKKEIRFSS